MTVWKTVKIPAPLADIIDKLVDSGQYSSRAEYVKEAIRNDLRERDLLGDIQIGTTHTQKLSGGTEGNE